jgi:protein-L-isoaspartate(D-aspartate) O-methyltransferase
MSHNPRAGAVARHRQVWILLGVAERRIKIQPMPSGEQAEPEVRRQRLVDSWTEAGAIRDPRVLAAMRAVPREAFVPAELRERAYDDAPLPIGAGQTISQPFMVARMAQALELSGEERVLEVGTGSGYAAAVLSLLAREVHSIERIESLAASAAGRLHALGYANVRVHVGDGTRGWSPSEPYQAIVVAAAGPRVPPELLRQLTDPGRLVLPIGEYEEQVLVRIRRTATGDEREELEVVRFVPLVGEDAADAAPPH